MAPRHSAPCHGIRGLSRLRIRVVAFRFSGMAALSDTEYSFRKIERGGRKDGVRSAMVIGNTGRAGRCVLIALVAMGASLMCQLCAAQTPDPKLDAAIQRVTQRPEFRHSIFGVEVYSL